MITQYTTLWMILDEQLSFIQEKTEAWRYYVRAQLQNSVTWASFADSMHARSPSGFQRHLFLLWNVYFILGPHWVLCNLIKAMCTFIICDVVYNILSVIAFSSSVLVNAHSFPECSGPLKASLVSPRLGGGGAPSLFLVSSLPWCWVSAFSLCTDFSLSSATLRFSGRQKKKGCFLAVSPYNSTEKGL